MVITTVFRNDVFLEVERMKRIVLLAAIMTASFARADVCKWGLGYESAASSCQAKQITAATRITRAKTICYADTSEVQWDKRLKNFDSKSSLRHMRGAMTVVSTGYRLVLSCEHADLVAKLEVDRSYSEKVSLEVTDADSGDLVFAEERDLRDESGDLSRLANHFQAARAEAKQMQTEIKTAPSGEQKRETTARLAQPTTSYTPADPVTHATTPGTVQENGEDVAACTTNLHNIIGGSVVTGTVVKGEWVKIINDQHGYAVKVATDKSEVGADRA